MSISLRAARVNAGLTQKEVAKRVGISNTTLCKYEQGKESPPVNLAIALCELYKMDFNSIFFN